MENNDNFTENDDGSITFDFSGHPQAQEILGHNENLALHIAEEDLDLIANELIQLIEEDDQSRTKWLNDRAKGVEILGLEVEESRKSSGGTVPVDGMAASRHPLLVDSCIHFHSNASNELLPSKGPVRIVNDSGETIKDGPASVLQKELNRYLLKTCPEYIPDTDRMIFQTGWCGAGFKKGFHCPLRRRSVIDSVDAKDLIISDRATSLSDAERITERVYMGKAKFKRMQIVGAYRNIELATPVEEKSVLDIAVSESQGITQSSNPQSADRQLYECYCDYDLPGFEHEIDGDLSGLPLPYKITIDVQSKRILEIRRDWKEGDETYMRRRTFVMYPFIPMFGLWPSGLLHLLGNTTSALTTAWRVLLDSGMFANFPGFLYLKNGARQQDPDFRVGPGQGAGIDSGGQQDITKTVMPLPYKEPGASTIGLVDTMAADGRRLAGTTEIKVGDGGREVPVGTMAMALEQAWKVLSAVHRRMHTAQSEEFQMLKDLLKEDPESLWRNEDGERLSYAEKIAIIQALHDHDLSPAADPNVPSYLHRVMRSMILKQFSGERPDLYNPYAVDEYALTQVGIRDPQRFFVPPQPPKEQIDPVQAMAEVEQQKNVVKFQTEKLKNETKQLNIAVDHADKEADRKSKEHIEVIKLMERIGQNNKDE